MSLVDQAPSSRKKSPLKGTKIFFERFLKNPTRVASVIPSSPILVKKVLKKMDLSQPRVIAEFGPGEGVHTRAILRRAHPQSRLFLFELDPGLAEYLRAEFAHDPRVTVLNTNCCKILDVMKENGIEHFDYIFSGIPFSLMDPEIKQALMHDIYSALRPNSCFIIYQVTNELTRFGQHFDNLESAWCPFNIPPMFVTVYHKNGKSAAGAISNGIGNGKGH